MASAYKSYEPVKTVQEYLESLKDDGSVSFSKSLREADGTFDGKWGPDTDTAFWAWLERQEPGSDLRTLAAAGVISEDDLEVLSRAMAEHGKIVEDKAAESGTPKTPDAAAPVPPIPPAKSGWSTATWVILGIVVAGAGVGGYYWMKNRKVLSPKLRPARSHAGMGKLGDGGCGCSG